MDKRTFIKMSAIFGAGIIVENDLSGSSLSATNTITDTRQHIRRIKEPAGNIPVCDEVDVLVCGGGLGGTAAALAAARAGAGTMIVERNSCLGGNATAGMCCSIFNCYFTGGVDRRLETHGIALEIADALAESTGYGQKWRQHKGHIIFDLEKAKFILQEIVKNAGVKVLLGTWNAGVLMDHNRIRGVIVENKSARQVILAKAVVDATGDADIASFAGAPLQILDKGLNSLTFRFGNVNVDRFIKYFEEHPGEYPEHMDIDWTLEEAMAQYRNCGTFLFPHGGGMQMEAFKNAKLSGDLPETVGIQNTTNASQMHALRKTGVVHIITGFTQVSGIDADGLTKSIIDGREMIFKVSEAYRKYLPGFENSFVSGVADNLGVRWSRRISGGLQFPGAISGMRATDAIGRSVGWDNVVKHPGKGAWAAAVNHNDSFDIPLSCLLPDDVEGLVIGAGRSANTKGIADLRVMAHTMVVGQGAGITAAMSAKTGDVPRNVPISLVQEELKRQGALQ